MTEILYIGRSNLVSASATLVREEGHAVVNIPTRNALSWVCRPGCRAIVISWTSGQTGPAIAQAAKKRGIPVIVVTSRLVRAFRLFGTLADIYLEQPASPEEIATLAIAQVLQTQPTEAGQPAAAATAA